MSTKFACCLSLILLLAGQVTVAQNVIEDQGVGMSREELEFIVKYWTPQMQEAAARDAGDRIELLNISLAAKKIAREAERLTPEVDGELYWKNVMLVRNAQKRFVLDNYMSKLEVPDMSALAQERYLTEKDKYARVPEQRLSSQILIMCLASSDCVRKQRRPLAEKILAELRAGANFDELVQSYSEDTGTKTKGGKFDKWISPGEPKLLPQYVGGLFDIKEVGGYSGVVETEAGFHIIRLDEVRPAHYRTYEEVRPAIIQALEKEYRILAAKQFDARYRLTDKATMDNKVLDEIFARYKTSDPSGQKPVGSAGAR